MTAPLSENVRALLAGLRKVLDLPEGAGPLDALARDRLLERRVAAVLGNLDYLLDSEAAEVPVAVEALGRAVAREPVTYTPYEPEAGS